MNKIYTRSIKLNVTIASKQKKNTQRMLSSQRRCQNSSKLEKYWCNCICRTYQGHDQRLFKERSAVILRRV